MSANQEIHRGAYHYPGDRTRYSFRQSLRESLQTVWFVFQAAKRTKADRLKNCTKPIEPETRFGFVRAGTIRACRRFFRSWS